MRHKFTLYISFLLVLILVVSQPACLEKQGLNVQWSTTFYDEESGFSIGHTVQQTTDGGCIIYAESDSWLIKTDADGNRTWDKKFYIKDGYARGSSAQQTTDGGYILGATRYFFNDPKVVVWLIKTDGQGNKIWDKTFTCEKRIEETGVLLQQTTDGSYIICVNTYSLSSVRDHATYTKDHDIWLIKTDTEGNIIWDKPFTYQDVNVSAISIKQTTDGGYLICASRQHTNAWLIKTDADGIKLWDRVFYGFRWDGVNTVQQTTDGGYIMCGYTEHYMTGKNICLIKIDAGGNKLWDKTFNCGDGKSVHQTADGGYIVFGTCGIWVGLLPRACVIRTDAHGNKLWDKTFGEGWIRVDSVQQTADGGYIVLGKYRGAILLLKLAPER